MKAISVTTSGSQVGLSGGPGSLTATVANQESTPERVVLAVVAQGGGTAGAAAPSATVEDPLREIDAGSTEQYLVTFTPGSAAPGTYPVKIVAYPADEAPEEYAPSGQRIDVVVGGKPVPLAPPARKFPWWIVAVAAALVVVIGVVAFVLTRPKSVTVPAVTAKVQSDAEKTISDAGLSPSVVTAVSKPPLGVVVSQSPDPSTEVPRGTTVTITVSTGVAVPDVGRKPAASAQADLVKLGLKVVSQAKESDAAPGTVIEQKPAPGTQLGLGESVALTIATPVMVTVPPVAGLTFADAQTVFAAVGLVAQRDDSQCVFPGLCKLSTGSRPGTGAKVPKGSTVVVVVNRLL